MKNIFEIMKEYGLEVPEDKKKEFEKTVLENYKTMTDYDNQAKKLDAANETIKANDTAMKDLQDKLDGFKDVDVSGLNQRINDLETEKANIQKDYDAKIADRDFNDLVKENIAAANGKNAKAIMDKIVATLGKVYVWYARYGVSLSEAELNLADIWQYTSSGVVPGISGKCDINIFYTDFEMVSVPAEREEVCNINIQNFQEAANADGYRDEQGRKLVEDGKDGPNTQYVRRQICLQAKRVGLIYKVGSTGAVVKWWQTRCNEILGGNQDTDGRYGKTARTETIKLQKKLNLTADGKAGYNSLQAAFYN